MFLGNVEDYIDYHLYKYTAIICQIHPKKFSLIIMSLIVQYLLHLLTSQFYVISKNNRNGKIFTLTPSVFI